VSPTVRASTIGLRAGVLALLIAGCASGPGHHTDDGVEAPAAREGLPAASTRVTFVPEQVTLPGGSTAAVRPASTVDGLLVVPENVHHVGWWDSSASSGDPYGSTVIAGHVDSAAGGLGYFSRLLSIRKGERVTVRSGKHRLTYRVTSVRSVRQGALATTSAAFDQKGDHRLALITCTGTFRPGRGYDRNLVVIGEPLGLAR
jgi:LPXTG-site transpeptidase (sortase) family protein